MPATTAVKDYKPLYAYNSPFGKSQNLTDNVFDLTKQIRYIYKSKDEIIVEQLIECFINDLKNKLSNLFIRFQRNQKQNPSYLSNFSKIEVVNAVMFTGTALLIKNPAIIVAEPTAEDTLFFTAKYGEKTCYVEVYFEENEIPTCSLNIFENKKTIYSRVGTIEKVMNNFLSLEPTFTA